jgi:hypothetical protein
VKKCLTIAKATLLRDQIALLILSRPADSGVGFAAAARRLGW